MRVPDVEQLARWHVEALFHFDARGRMRFVREPGYVEPDLDLAPRVFVHRAPTGTTWRVRDDLPDDLASAVDHLLRTEPTLPRPPDETDVPHTRDALLALLEQHAPVHDEHRGPTWWLPDPAHLPSTATRVTEATAPSLLDLHFAARRSSPAGWERGGVIASVEDGVAVALCFHARRTDHAAEAGVVTVEAYRGRGHARAAVAAWTRLVNASGRVALYSTDWTNHASRRVASALGAVPYGEDWSLT